MSRQYFGTDGIRGRVNTSPMTAETALRLAIATSRIFASDGPAEVIIGQDTRNSGSMIEAALVAGFTSMGVTPVLIGVVPTPTVAMMTRETGAALGLMISASHNKADDNGLKLFSPEGTKFPDDVEEAIEMGMRNALEGDFAAPADIGSAKTLDGAGDLYVKAVLATMPEGLSLNGMKIVLDCANGAGAHVAPEALTALGADLTTIGNTPDGRNINAGVGSTETAALKAAVLAQGADVGIALDGDADRVLVIDETGAEIDGDQIMGLIATELHQSARLSGGGMVATVMSNMGLAEHLKGLGLSLARTKVGDRYVGEHMRQHGYNLGGEQSGHIILSDVSTTGDGLLAGLHVLAVLARSDQPMSKVGHVFDPAPQKLVNIRYSGDNPLATEAVKTALLESEAMMGDRGRMVVRKSGTEPLIRVMAEALDADLMERALAHSVAAVEKIGAT